MNNEKKAYLDAVRECMADGATLAVGKNEEEYSRGDLTNRRREQPQASSISFQFPFPVSALSLSFSSWFSFGCSSFEDVACSTEKLLSSSSSFAPLDSRPGLLFLFLVLSLLTSNAAQDRLLPFRPFSRVYLCQS